jgi:hypothetical protein
VLAVCVARRASRRKRVERAGRAAYSPTIESRTTQPAAQSTHHRKESIMTQTLTTRIASFALAALMTLGMLGSISGFAQVETRLGAENALVAQATQAAARA